MNMSLRLPHSGPSLASVDSIRFDEDNTQSETNFSSHPNRHGCSTTTTATSSENTEFDSQLSSAASSLLFGDSNNNTNATNRMMLFPVKMESTAHNYFLSNSTLKTSKITEEYAKFMELNNVNLKLDIEFKMKTRDLQFQINTNKEISILRHEDSLRFLLVDALKTNDLTKAEKINSILNTTNPQKAENFNFERRKRKIEVIELDCEDKEPEETSTEKPKKSHTENGIEKVRFPSEIAMPIVAQVDSNEPVPSLPFNPKRYRHLISYLTLKKLNCTSLVKKGAVPVYYSCCTDPPPKCVANEHFHYIVDLDKFSLPNVSKIKFNCFAKSCMVKTQSELEKTVNKYFMERTV